jgi:hypothetical protein
MTKAVSALPLILYSAWVSIALWDLVRQEAVPNRTRVLWMLVVLVVPLAGPIAYYALGVRRSSGR